MSGWEVVALCAIAFALRQWWLRLCVSLWTRRRDNAEAKLYRISRRRL